MLGVTGVDVLLGVGVLELVGVGDNVDVDVFVGLGVLVDVEVGSSVAESVCVTWIPISSTPSGGMKPNMSS